MSTFVLVPGAWHGGWWYDPVVADLDAHGHRSSAITPAGLGPHDDLTSTVVTLETHIGQVIAEVERLAGDGPVVLVGHSYGGALVTAAADRVPGHVKALIHLDSDIPEDGQSLWDLTPQHNRDWFVRGAGETGVGVAPLPFFDQRARPHPLATLVQRFSLTGAWQKVPVKRYAAALDTPGGLQAPDTMAKIRTDPQWEYQEWPTSHNVLRDGPERVLALLTDL